jgi:hypothetical protein
MSSDPVSAIIARAKNPSGTNAANTTDTNALIGRIKTAATTMVTISFSSVFFE